MNISKIYHHWLQARSLLNIKVKKEIVRRIPNLPILIMEQLGSRSMLGFHDLSMHLPVVQES